MIKFTRYFKYLIFINILIPTIGDSAISISLQDNERTVTESYTVNVGAANLLKTRHLNEVVTKVDITFDGTGNYDVKDVMIPLMQKYDLNHQKYVGRHQYQLNFIRVTGDAEKNSVISVLNEIVKLDKTKYILSRIQNVTIEPEWSEIIRAFMNLVSQANISSSEVEFAYDSWDTIAKEEIKDLKRIMGANLSGRDLESDS